MSQIAQAASQPAAVGWVAEASAPAVAVAASGVERALLPGNPIYPDDTLETGGGGALTVGFIDGTLFSLGEGGRLSVDSVLYEPGGAGNGLVLSMLQGAFSFLTGAIAEGQGDGMEVVTPVGSIGVRGTAGIGSVSDEVLICLLPDADAAPDAISFTNDAGTVLLDTFYEVLRVGSRSAPLPEPTLWSPERVEQTFPQTLDALRRGIERQRSDNEERRGDEDVEKLFAGDILEQGAGGPTATGFDAAEAFAHGDTLDGLAELQTAAYLVVMD